jgi:hypothetical protein
MTKSTLEDYILWRMTLQEEGALIQLLDQYANKTFWLEYPKTMIKKKLFKAYDLTRVKIWNRWVDSWYDELVYRDFGQALAYLVTKMQQKNLLTADEAKILPYWTNASNHGQIFPLPKNVEARFLLLKALFELSIEKDDIEWGLWKSEKTLALKLKMDQYKSEGPDDFTELYLKKYKIIEN